MRTDRLETFSDGVLAIAITLLVLQIPVPRGSAHEVLVALGGQWPAYGAYAVSFLTIGIVWVNHHNLFDTVRVANRLLLYLNLVLLMLVAVLPFPTALVADGISFSVDDLGRVAVAVYGGTLMIISAMFLVIRLYVAKRPHLVVEEAVPQLPAMTRRAAVGPVCYAVATLIGLVLPIVGLMLFAVIVLYYMVSTATVTPKE